MRDSAELSSLQRSAGVAAASACGHRDAKLAHLHDEHSSHFATNANLRIHASESLQKLR